MRSECGDGEATRRGESDVKWMLWQDEREISDDDTPFEEQRVAIACLFYTTLVLRSNRR